MTVRRGLAYSILLGLRSGVGLGTARRSLGLLSVAVLSIAAVTYVALVAVSTVQVADAQAMVVANRGLVGSTGESSGVEPRAAVVRDWFGDRAGTRVVVWADQQSPSVPGTGTLEVGECAASPALLRFIEEHPEAKGRFCEGPLGTIDDAGLTDPDEMFGVVVRPLADPGGSPFRSFGADSASLGEADAAASEVQGSVLLAALLVFPMCVALLVGCVRASTRRRERRIGAYRMVGATSTQIAAVLTAEVLVLGCPGVLLGLGAHRLTAEFLSGHIGSVSWYSQDARVGIAGFLVMIGVLAIAVVASVAPSLWALRRPMTARRNIVVRSRLRWVLGAQVVLVAAWWAQTLGSSPATFDEARPRLLLALVTLGAQMLVLPVFAARLGRWIGEVVGRRAEGVAPHLAGRVVESSPPIGRQLAGACLAVVLLGTTAFYGAGLVGSVQRHLVDSDVARPFERAITITNAPPEVAERLEEIDGVEQVMHLTELTLDLNAMEPGVSVVAGPGSALVGPCPELAWYLGLDVTCDRPLESRVRGASDHILPQPGSTATMTGGPVGSPSVIVTAPEEISDVEWPTSAAIPQTMPSLLIDDRVINYPDLSTDTLQVVPATRADIVEIEQQIRSTVNSVGTGVAITSPASLAHEVNADLSRYLWSIGVVAVFTAGLLVLFVLVGIADSSQTLRFAFSRFTMAGAPIRAKVRAAGTLVAIFAASAAVVSGSVVVLANRVVAHIYPTLTNPNTWTASALAAVSALVIVVGGLGAAAFSSARTTNTLSLERDE